MLGIVIGCSFFLGWKSSFLFGKKKIQKVRDLKYGELKKIYDLTNNKMKTSVSELTELVDWVNKELPEALTIEILADPRLTVLKNKGGIPDKDYIEAFEEVILDFQKVVATRIQITMDNINKKLVEDLKGLIDDSIQEK